MDVATKLDEPSGGEAKAGGGGSAARFTYASGAKPLAGYTIKRGIGHGGFGEVYYATSDAGKEVAIKLIRRNLDVELRGVTQCLNLKHPNLLSLYDVRQDDASDTWVVMELMVGDSLEARLARSPEGLQVEEALAWIHGIAAGVAYLHDHGIVHRDLKPGNIFVDEGIVKIGDYGLSKFISCSRRSGQTGSVGTVHYMAPEIANGRYGKEIDIYALGVMLYEMLTGHVPFEGESIGEILMKHLTAEPDCSRVAEPYCTIVTRCLAKDPEKRIHTVGEMLAMLPAAPTGSGGQFAGASAALVAASQNAVALDRPVKSDAFSQLVPVSRTPPPLPSNAPAPVRPVLPLHQESPSNAKPAKEPIARMARSCGVALHRVFGPQNSRVIMLIGLATAIMIILFVGRFARGAPSAFMLTALGLVPLYLIFRIASSQHHREKKRLAESALSSGTANVSQSASVEIRKPLSGTRLRWQEQSQYDPGTPRERMTQLLSSMLLAAFVCLVLALVMLILRGQSPEPTQYAWLAISAIVGSWAVLLPAKCWEGAKGDAALRRFAMLVVGMALGVLIYGITEWLMVSMPYDERWITGPGKQLRRAFYETDGAPTLLAFLAYFGFLFAVLRWWRLADPRRPMRLSVWHTAIGILGAIVMGWFWPFPQPWGWMLVATIAIAVQLASPCGVKRSNEHSIRAGGA